MADSLIAITDWAGTGAMMAGIGSWGQTAATAFGAYAVLRAAKIAGNTFAAWKTEKITERRMEHAERILAATYKAQDALSAVRAPMLWGYELIAAEEQLSKSDSFIQLPKARRQPLIRARVYFDRVDRHLSEREKLLEAKPFARALWGTDLSDALDHLNDRFYLIQTYAEEAIDHDYQSTDPDDLARRKKIREALAVSPTRPDDEISTTVAAAISKVEEHCLPTLRLDVDAPKQVGRPEGRP